MKTQFEWRYISTHSLLRHYMDVSGQSQALAALYPVKTLRYALRGKLGGRQRFGDFGEELNHLRLQGFDS